MTVPMLLAAEVVSSPEGVIAAATFAAIAGVCLRMMWGSWDRFVAHQPGGREYEKMRDERDSERAHRRALEAQLRAAGMIPVAAPNGE